MKKSDFQFDSKMWVNRMKFDAQNIRMLGEGSPFAGKFEPDDWKAYIEFDICHSFPVLCGPESVAGNYIGYHPAVLARSFGGLIHQQTNLHHKIKAYNPKKNDRDRIMGAVVATWYPPTPDGGWKIPATKEESIPIKVLAVVFKQAEGVKDILEKKQKWSVSIEGTLKSLDDLGIYVPSTRTITPILQANDELLTAVSINENKRYVIGKLNGEQLAFAYGCVEGKLIFQGVGYTPNPAEKEARITSIRMERGEENCLALRAESFDEPDIKAAVAKKFRGAVLEQTWTEGKGTLTGSNFFLPASEEDPVLRIRLSNGGRILKKQSQILS